MQGNIVGQIFFFPRGRASPPGGQNTILPSKLSFLRWSPSPHPQRRGVVFLAGGGVIVFPPLDPILPPPHSGASNDLRRPLAHRPLPFFGGDDGFSDSLRRPVFPSLPLRGHDVFFLSSSSCFLRTLIFQNPFSFFSTSNVLLFKHESESCCVLFLVVPPGVSFQRRDILGSFDFAMFFFW